MTHDFQNPPVTAVIPAGAESTALTCLTLLLALTTLIVLWRARVGMRPIALLCIVGGAAAVTFDAQLNVLTLRWFPANAQQIVYTSSGRTVPLFWLCFQAWFVGCGTAWLIAARRTTVQDLWPTVWMLAAIRLLAEWIGVQAGLWLYYGWQPFCVLGVPLWVPVTSAVAVVASARFVAFSLRTHHRASVLIGVPLAWSIAVAMQIWPISLALNHRDSDVVFASVAMVAVFLMAGLFVEFVQRLSRSQGEGVLP